MGLQFARTITLAMTGASGLPYGLRLLQCLLAHEIQVYLLVSKAAYAVAAQETKLKLPGQTDKLQAFLAQELQAQPGQLQVFAEHEWTAPIASGSAAVDAMVICPCSSGAIAAIAAGISDNLIERAADVVLKEKKPLILVHREMPLSTIHLENMLRLAHAGATIFPASPGFYHNPSNISDLVDFVVARVLDHLQIKHALFLPWGTKS